MTRRPVPLRSMGQAVTIAVTIFVAALLAFSGSVAVLSLNTNDQARTNASLLTRITNVTARNDRETCRAAYAVFKEQRTQIVQGRALLHAGLLPGLTPQSIRLLDALYDERYRRVANSNLPDYCGDLRHRPNSIFKSKIVTTSGGVTPPLFQPFSGDLTTHFPSAAPGPNSGPTAPQRPPTAPQTPSVPKPSVPAPNPPLTGPVRPPDVAKPPSPGVCATVPLVGTVCAP